MVDRRLYRVTNHAPYATTHITWMQQQQQPCAHTDTTLGCVFFDFNLFLSIVIFTACILLPQPPPPPHQQTTNRRGPQKNTHRARDMRGRLHTCIRSLMSVLAKVRCICDLSPDKWCRMVRVGSPHEFNVSTGIRYHFLLTKLFILNRLNVLKA